MKALTWQGKKNLRIEEVPDPRIEQPNDAVSRLTSTRSVARPAPLRPDRAFLSTGDVQARDVGVVEEVGPGHPHQPATAS